MTVGVRRRTKVKAQGRLIAALEQRLSQKKKGRARAKAQSRPGMMKNPGQVNQAAASLPPQVVNMSLNRSLVGTKGMARPQAVMGRVERQYAKAHPHFSWDPLANPTPPPEVFSVGTSTFIPAVTRKKITTLPSTGLPADYGGVVILAMTPANSGLAAVYFTLASTGSDPSIIVKATPWSFPRMTSADSGNLPTSARPGRYGYYLRNTSDQLKLGGTVRVLRLTTGVALPGQGGAPAGTAQVTQFEILKDFIESHPETASYSGNQLTTGKGQACIPSNQSKYMNYTPWTITPPGLSEADWPGGENHQKALELRAALGQDHGEHHHEGDAHAVAAAGSGMAAVQNRLAHQAVYEGIRKEDLTQAQIDSLNAADTTQEFIDYCLDPAMSVLLVMFEPRDDNQNTYEFTVGTQLLCRYPAGSMLNSLAQPTKTAPVAAINHMRSQGESTKSFLTEVGDVAKNIGGGIKHAVEWGVKEIPGIIAGGQAIGRMIAPLL